FIGEFVEQAIGRRNPGCDDFPKGVEETAFIVAGAIEPCPVREAKSRYLQNSAGEVPHRLSVRRHRVERQLRHLVAELLALLDAPVFHQVPGRVERLLVVEEAYPQSREPADSAPAPAIGSAHLEEALQANFRKGGRKVIDPVAEPRLFAPKL